MQTWKKSSNKPCEPESEIDSIKAEGCEEKIEEFLFSCELLEMDKNPAIILLMNVGFKKTGWWELLHLEHASWDYTETREMIWNLSVTHETGIL